MCQYAQSSTLLLWAAHVSSRPTKKEVVAISHENTPSVTRRSLLRLLVLLVGICVFVGLVGIVVGWVGTYIVPVVVSLAVVIYIVALGLWVAERWPMPPNRDRMQ
jgi:cytochrome c biogenesis protein CcdA